MAAFRHQPTVRTEEYQASLPAEWACWVRGVSYLGAVTNLTVKVPPELSHATALIIAQSPGAEPQIADLKPEILRFDPFTWPGEIPAGCPFARAKAFQADFVNIPSQFIGDDGVTMWRRYSGGFSIRRASRIRIIRPAATTA